ncbi:hypothetical protein IJG92_00610 [Candidatus Saccharibacteria bacterium]|nr:hypothetical protein [Candidatus Saccharibacteria bacterium]
MAKKKVQKRKKNYFKIGSFKITKKLAIFLFCVLVSIVGFMFFRTSDYWPWPSQDEVDQRLINVIDACIYNEGSRACTNLQKRYNMTFEYCYALSDIPEIGVAMPIYGVTKKNTFIPSSINYEPAHRGSSHDYPVSSYEYDKLSDEIKRATSSGYTAQIGVKGDSKYPYYGCTGSLDKARDQKGTNLIENPETIALFGLSKIPQYSMTYDPHGEYGCTLHHASINNLWMQIPNISVIRDEVNNLSRVYPYCNMQTDIDNFIANLNTKLSNYANDYSTQLFYQKYDEWSIREGTGCTWYDTKFSNQLCGAASDGESAGSDVMLKDFITDMSKYLHTNYFTSKIVVTD